MNHTPDISEEQLCPDYSCHLENAYDTFEGEHGRLPSTKEETQATLQAAAVESANCDMLHDGYEA